MWNHVPDPVMDVGEITLAPADQTEISIDLSKGVKGDVEAAKRLLHRFCSAVTERKQIDDRIMEHLCDAFLAVLDENASADRKLWLIKKRGRQSNPDRTERNLKIWSEILKRRRNDDDQTVEEVCAKVAPDFSLSAESIERIYKDMKRLQLSLLAKGRKVTDEDWEKIDKLLARDESTD